MRFGFIRQQMKAYPVTVLCKVMEVSRSGFYDYLIDSTQTVTITLRRACWSHEYD